MFTSFLPSLRMLIALSVLTGIVYPFVTWGIAQTAFPSAANGSLVQQGSKTVASTLIGQPFDDPKYFWSRPSATSPQPYNGASSSGSNLGPRNPALADAVKDRIKALRDADPTNRSPVPADLAARVAKARGLPVEAVRALVTQNTEGRTFGVLGEPRVNVVRLNLALDQSGK